MAERLKNLPESERPREKAIMHGIRSLSSRELLAILIRSGIRGTSALDAADHLLLKSGGVNGLLKLSRYDMKQVPGISEVKALELEACMELSRRISYERAAEADVVRSPEGLYDWLKKEIGSGDQEQFMAIFLDQANHILSARTLFIGTVNSSMVSPREVFREALLHGAVNVIVVHNHPGGTLAPSQADLDATARIIEAGRMMGIPVLDHLIVSSKGVYSFRREGLLTD